MNRPLQETQADKSTYERPAQKWVCGHTADGTPCRIGPGPQGQCQAAWECEPLAQGTHWRCSRPASAGGPCSEGPRPLGECSRPVPPCQPVRSLGAKRGLITRLAVIFSFGLVLLLFFPLLVRTPEPGWWKGELRRWSETIVSPGPLSAPHGTIGNCNRCHPVELGPNPGLGSTMACLDCHNGPTSPDAPALQPHGLPPQQLAAVTQEAVDRGATPSTDAVGRLLGLEIPRGHQGALACATCHREHRGRLASITNMDDQRCQACHLENIANFNSHPEFTRYPLAETRYGFDHRAHATRIKAADFACANCHEADDTGRHMEVARFEQALHHLPRPHRSDRPGARPGLLSVACSRPDNAGRSGCRDRGMALRGQPR